MARSYASPTILYGVRGREQARRRGWLFGAGAAWEGFGGNVGQVVRVGHKTLPASKEGQHTVCSLMVGEKPVVSARWSGSVVSPCPIA